MHDDTAILRMDGINKWRGNKKYKKFWMREYTFKRNTNLGYFRTEFAIHYELFQSHLNITRENKRYREYSRKKTQKKYTK